ncbi:mycofactocin-coupled SDR family oxidoreductase [Gordonia crocea]|uniref:3-ketoacyl-ACP reductase n=1 Tax=Gordonia crocea TaxID=589162 RepID=A0A7I9UY88_9ACTN|nr:mycofactocin-coupled SDR family oxidoreductase [Gordonia crocea]GED97770.1 3-ketoacyl-ACP reductase [Gordonia crocea]
MTGRLDGQVALVTGAARGQGRAHCVRLASKGADIIAVDIAGPLPADVPYESATPADLAETQRLVAETGATIITAQTDVRDLDALKRVVDDGVARLGKLTIAVANAGICIPVIWDQTTPELFDDVIGTNVRGVWNTVMASAHHIIDAGGGSIILISSYAGKKVQPFMVPYTTSKHAVTGMTRAFAAELGQYNVRVNSVHPGGVATPMGGGDMVAALERTGASNPKLNAMGTTFTDLPYTEPEVVANVVAFLASDESTFMTAEHISVDGGAQYF